MEKLGVFIPVLNQNKCTSVNFFVTIKRHMYKRPQVAESGRVIRVLERIIENSGTNNYFLGGSAYIIISYIFCRLELNPMNLSASLSTAQLLPSVHIY
jgi:hypothetical protein